MAKSDEQIVNFRIAPRDQAAMDRLVERGDFRNRSDFLRFAVKMALRDAENAQGDPRRVAPPDLTLEAVDLPQQDAPRTRASSRSTRSRSQ